PVVPAPVTSDLGAGYAIYINRCPVTMLITDPLGRRIGTTPSGQDVNEIPGGFYTGHDVDNGPDLLWFPQPTSGVYTVTVTGLKADTFAITGQVISTTTTTRLGLFSGSIQPGQVFTYTTAPYQPQQQRRLLLVEDQAGAGVAGPYSTALTQLGYTPEVW